MRKFNGPLSILTVEDNPSDLLLVEHMLKVSPLGIHKLYSAERITGALEILQTVPISLVLLDLSLPDSFGIHSFLSIRPAVQNIPVIILTGLSDAGVALEAIKEGAQDYLVKGEFNENLLVKSIQYSIERKRNLESLWESNERFNRVAKVTNDAVWDWDMIDNKVFLIGDGFKQLFGYDIVDAVSPADLWEGILHPEDKPRVIDKLERLIREGGVTVWNDEYRLRKSDGEYAYVHDRGTIIYSHADQTPVRMIGAVQDITARKKAEEIILASEKLRQQQITGLVLDAQEKERTELGKELHDNINQILATSKLYLDLAIEEAIPRKELLVKSRQNIAMAIEEIRKLSKELIAPSLNDLGLLQSVGELIRNIQSVKKMKIKLVSNGIKEELLREEEKITIYRIIQEQLNNILKHAQASVVVIELNMEKEQLYLSVQDNGKGFDTRLRRKGIGLSNIVSRAGLYHGSVGIESAPGEGCRLEVILPAKDHLIKKQV